MKSFHLTLFFKWRVSTVQSFEYLAEDLPPTVVFCLFFNTRMPLFLSMIAMVNLTFYFQDPKVYHPIHPFLTVNPILTSGLAFAWTAMFSFEVLIFFMTLYKSLMCKQRLNGNYTIVYVMIRDGECFFFLPIVPKQLITILGTIYFG